MNNNYRVLAESVRQRINPENFAFEKSFSDELSTISYSDVLIYVRLAMKGVEPEYTRITKLAGDRVKEHLSTLTDVEFRYQGSVMTNTHIRSYSDIDLLVISKNFYTWDRDNSNQIINNQYLRERYYQYQIEKIQNEINAPSYGKDSLTELRTIRSDSETILKDKYSICDITKPKSVKITNLSLKRDVDIVVANWYDDVLSIINNKGQFRGIQVYNKDSHTKGNADFPFLSIDRINERGSITTGRIKKMIRLLKNLKAKSDHDIKLSSFDFNAICYDINVQDYQNLIFYQLVPVLYKQLKSLAANTTHSDNLVSVDGREYIFRNNLQKLDSLRFLLAELEGVYNDLNQQSLKVRI
jgi:hypothetical protein